MTLGIRLPVGIENEWLSANEGEESNTVIDISSQPTMNSQLMASPSQITLIPFYPSFPLSDTWPDLDSFEDSNAPPNSALDTPVEYNEPYLVCYHVCFVLFCFNCFVT